MTILDRSSLNVPNLLTTVRIALVPFFVLLVLEGELFTAAIIFAAAGITDALDGYVARRFDMRTPLGAILDPLADKFLQISAFVVLAWAGFIPVFLTVLVILRDVVILGGYSIVRLTGRSVEVRPTVIGKATTVIQIAMVLIVLVVGGGQGDGEGGWREILFWAIVVVTTTATILSGAVYVTREVKIQWGRGG